MGQALDSPERLQALDATGLMDSEATERYDRLTKLASSVLRAPVALMSLVDDHRQFFKSSLGLPEPFATARETPLSHSFCQHVVTSGRPLRVENAPEDPLVKDNLAIPDLGVISYLGVPIVTESGHNLGSFCVVDTVPRSWTDTDEQLLRELTELLQTEISLKLALANSETLAREALAANRAKSDFLARMSHELRTPLNSVIGFANVMLHNKAGNLRDVELTYLSRIQHNGVHLLGLINGLLDLAKIESGKMQVEIGVVDLRSLISDVIAQLEVEAQLKGVDLIAVIPDGIRPMETDKSKLAQVLMNLVANAVKFTSKGLVSVVVAADGDAVARSISVADSGIGIPADRLDAIFNPFEQAEKNTSASYGGTGLGLPISKSLAELLGFRLKVESVAGVGSTFTIYL